MEKTLINALQESIKYNVEISEHIKKVCFPLEKYFGINLIAYRKFYFDGGLLYLFNNNNWMKFSFDKKCWNSISFQDRIKSISYNSTLYYSWPDKPPKDDFVYSALYEHDLWNGVIVYKKYTDCLETYAFATSRNNTSARNIYVLETYILEHFISYFKDKILSFICPIENKILIPFRLILPEHIIDKENKKLFFQETQVNNFYLRDNGYDVKLTKREYDCLSHLSNGKKFKEIAKLLNLSVRTVECYLNNAMKKTNYNCKSQLILLYQKNHRMYINQMIGRS